MNNLALSYDHFGRRREALKLSEEVLTLRRKLLGPEHTDTLLAMYNLASIHFNDGHQDEALKLREEVMSLFRKVHGPEHAYTLMVMNQLALSYAQVGRGDDALKLAGVWLAGVLRKDPQSPAGATVYAQMGFLLDAAGRGDDAIRAWQEAVRLDPTLANEHYWLGKGLADRQRFAEALPILRATQKFYANTDRALETAARLALAESIVEPEDPKARAPDGDSWKEWLAALGAWVVAHPDDTDKGKHLATVQLWLGQTNEHQALCRKMLGLAAQATDPATCDRAAKAFLIQSQSDAETLKLAVVAGRNALKLAAPGDSNRPWFLVTAAMAAVRDGGSAEAESLLSEVLRDPAGHPDRRALALAFRAIARVRLGRISDAQADFVELEKRVSQFPAVPTLSPIVTQPDTIAVLLAHREAKALLSAGLPAKP
jgi:predicted Zn-dependent protease